MGLAATAQKIGKLGIIYMVATVAGPVLGLLFLPVFTRYLEPSQMGIVTLAGQVLGPLAILVQLELWSALKSQYFRTDEADRPALVRAAVVGQLVQTGAMCILLTIAGFWLSGYFLPNLPLSSFYVNLLWLMVVWGGFFQTWFRIGTGLSELRENAVVSAGLTISQLLVQIGFGLLFVVVLGYGGFGRYVSVFIAFTIIGCASFYIAWGYGDGPFKFSLYKKVFKSGLTFLPYALAGMLALSMNGWLINSMISTAALGIYGVAVMFGQLIQFPLLAFGNASYPTLANMMRENTEATRIQHCRIYTFVFVGVAVLALGMIVLSPVVIDVMTDEEYHEAINLVPILVLAWFLQGLYWVASDRVFYHGGGLWLSASTVVSLVMVTSMSLLLIPLYGVYGAAWAMVGCFLSRVIIVFFVGERMYPLPWRLGILFKAFTFIGILVTLDLMLTASFGWLRMLPVKFLLLVAIIPAVRFSGVISMQELRYGWDLLRQKLLSFGKP